MMQQFVLLPGTVSVKAGYGIAGGGILSVPEGQSSGKLRAPSCEIHQDGEMRVIKK